MTATPLIETEDFAPTRPPHRRRLAGAALMTDRRPTLLAALLAIVALALAVFAVVTLVRDHPPGDDSVDAGFARDMAVQHAQAVEMAIVVSQRTDDPIIRTIATDVALTQQAQIGTMTGWLDASGPSTTGDVPPPR